MPKAVVLGCGKVGSVMAMDLAGSDDFEVVVADPSAAALEQVAGRARIEARELDCSDAAVVTALAEEHDIVIGALPSAMGYRSLETVIRTGTPMCDISFMTEDFLDLDALAREHETTVVADCGVAPGMSNMLSSWGVSKLDHAERVEILVGGVPRERYAPWEYKAGFSPYDVIEEYVRPSRVVEHGEIVIKEALSEPEPIEFPGVGTLEAFNTDGLRSLAETLDVPHMREKTLRYPGHIALAAALRDAGLFSEEPVEVEGVMVRPRALLAKLLFPKWTYEPMEEDLTVMRVTVEGDLDGVPTRFRWDLFDAMDPGTGFSSMARTTGFTCTVVARLMLDGTITRHGVFAPEHIATDEGVLDKVLAGLAERDVNYDARLESRD
ncbi:MAG: saccharopine dehydrogenase C-terminal domain-containing protein [Planctomycetota bacterium]|nr:saccharopine dehydrogenase C-terminal domain-containing protein [Planctomycetota bacterium]MEC9233070.1 saccharopine dehydrogenase C-terminal domain-containing protein [Planctomycetota bacterium]